MRHHPTALSDYQSSCARLLGFRPQRPNGATLGKQWSLHGGWLPARRGGRFLLQHHPRAREVLEETFILMWRRQDTTCMSAPMPTPSAPCSFLSSPAQCHEHDGLNHCSHCPR